MSQIVALSGTTVNGKTTVLGTVPSAADCASASQSAILPPLETQLTALSAQLVALQASVDAINNGGGGGGGGGDLIYLPQPIPNPTPSGSPTVLTTNTTLPQGTIALVYDAQANIAGNGIGTTIVDGANLRPAYNKAVIAINKIGATISNMTVIHAANSVADGSNAASIRNGNPGVDFTVSGVEVYGSQNGIQAFPATVVLNNVHTHHCGVGNTGNGETHNNYYNANGAGDPPNSLTDNNGVHEYACTGHCIKSRFKVNTFNGTLLRSAPIPGSPGNAADGTAQLGGNSAALNLPNAGEVHGTAHIIIGAGSANNLAFQYGVEGVYSGYATSATLDGWTFENQTNGNIQIQVGAGCSLVFTNTKIIGTKPILEPSSQGTLSIS